MAYRVPRGLEGDHQAAPSIRASDQEDPSFGLTSPGCDLATGTPGRATLSSAATSDAVEIAHLRHSDGSLLHCRSGGGVGATAPSSSSFLARVDAVLGRDHLSAAIIAWRVGSSRPSSSSARSLWQASVTTRLVKPPTIARRLAPRPLRPTCVPREPISSPLFLLLLCLGDLSELRQFPQVTDGLTPEDANQDLGMTPYRHVCGQERDQARWARSSAGIASVRQPRPRPRNKAAAVAPVAPSDSRSAERKTRRSKSHPTRCRSSKEQQR